MLQINWLGSQDRPYVALSPFLSPIWLLLMSLSFCFSSPPPFHPVRSGWVTLRRAEEKRGGRAEELSWAPTQALGEARCELHTSRQWQRVCSYGSVRQCLQTVHGPFTASALQKLPQELCAQNLIQHAKSVCRSPDSSCLPNTLNLFQRYHFAWWCFLFEILLLTYAGVLTLLLTHQVT